MLRRRVGTAPTTRPFRCERCRRLGLDPPLAVSPGPLEKRQGNGCWRDHANATRSNGHSWWSTHPGAIRLAREATVPAVLVLATDRERTAAAPG